MTIPMVFPDDTARARRTDPDTSHHAADVSDTAGSRQAVLMILAAYWNTPLADFQIEQIHDAAGGHYTGQRLRTARSELVERGVVVKDDTATLTPTGHKAATWRLR